MKETPILFSTPMVQVILDGRKTQTRRVVKVQPPACVTSAGVMLAPGMPHNGEWSWLSGDPKDVDSWGFEGGAFRCPYGQPGDRLWVREAWRCHVLRDDSPPRDIADGACILYEADNDRHQFHWAGKYRPPMFMPRWASRITLEITGVRVERLQEISEADAKAEGCDPVLLEREDDSGNGWTDYWYLGGYQHLWESINGPGSWEANPWVWVVEFKRVTT